MRVLCALGARDGAQLMMRALTYLPRERLDLVLLFVIDEGPRHGLERLRGPLGRGPRLGPERQAQIAAAEHGRMTPSTEARMHDRLQWWLYTPVIRNLLE